MTTPPTNARRARHAFTLVEALATIVVLSIVASVSSGILVQATDGFVEASTRAQLHAEASTALDRVVRELRRIARDTGATGVAPDIDSVTATAIGWEGDNQLALNGGDLELEIGGAGARTLLGDVTAFTVAAFDESDAAIVLPLAGAGCDPVRRLRVTLTLERQGVSVTLRTRVFMRCTMAGV